MASQSPQSSDRNSSQKAAVLTALLTLFKDSSTYMVGMGLIGLGNLILVPVLTNYLDRSEFGTYALIEVATLVIVTVTQMGFGVSYLKWFADTERGKRGALLGSMLGIGLVAASIGGVALWVTLEIGQVENWLQTTGYGFAWTLLPIVVLENVQGLLLTDLRARQRAIAYSAASVSRVLALIVASVWLIVFEDKGLDGVFFGRLIGDTIGVAVLTWLCLRSVLPSFSWKLASPMVFYGLPLIWGSLIWPLMDASGRYFVGRYVTLEEVGLYAAAIKISNIFQMMITQPFGIAWGGMMFRIAKSPNAQVVYAKIVSMTLVASVVIAFSLASFGPQLFRLFTSPEYFPANSILPVLFLVRVAQVLAYPISSGLYVSVKRTGIVAVIWTMAFAVSILANIVLVPRYGIVGASAAWLISEVVILVALRVFGQRRYRIPFEWGAILLTLIIIGLFWLLKDFLYGSLALAAVWSAVLVAVGVGYAYFNLCNDYQAR